MKTGPFEVTRVDRARSVDFVSYCKAHGSEHDDSYLPGDDFRSSADYPAFLLQHEGRTVGVACLIRTRRFADAKRGRLMIFHSTIGSSEAYSTLLDALVPHCEGLSYIYLFIPKQREAVRAIWESLGFFVERHSFVLKYDTGTIPVPRVPEGVVLTPFSPEDTQRIDACCDLVNQNFESVGGHVKIRPEDIVEMFESRFHLKGGIMLLEREDVPIGTLQIARDEEDASAATIEMLSVHSDYRRRGMALFMLRRGLAFARSRGFRDVLLSVNGENDAAITLYTGAGFRVIEVLICYGLDLPLQ